MLSIWQCPLLCILSCVCMPTQFVSLSKTNLIVTNKPHGTKMLKFPEVHLVTCRQHASKSLTCRCEEHARICNEIRNIMLNGRCPRKFTDETTSTLKFLTILQLLNGRQKFHCRKCSIPAGKFLKKSRSHNSTPTLLCSKNYSVLHRIYRDTISICKSTWVLSFTNCTGSQ